MDSLLKYIYCRNGFWLLWICVSLCGICISKAVFFNSVCVFCPDGWAAFKNWFYAKQIKKRTRPNIPQKSLLDCKTKTENFGITTSIVKVKSLIFHLKFVTEVSFTSPYTTNTIALYFNVLKMKIIRSDFVLNCNEN